MFSFIVGYILGVILWPVFVLLAMGYLLSCIFNFICSLF